MNRLAGGYTIIEVMLFLAISGVIFATATFVFNGQQDKTSFEQGIRDFSSQLQKYVDDISTSVFLGGSNYTCSTSASTGRPTLSAGSGGQGANQDCIFLGRAFQVVPTQQKVFIYTVLGNKNTPLGDTVTSFTNAMPTPALTSGTDLTDEYFASWGKVTSSKVKYTSGTVVDSDLVGFYNSLQDGYQNSGVTGAQSILAKAYNYQSTDINSARSAAVASCIEEQNANGVTCVGPSLISSWSICFASTRTTQTALLNVASTPAGVTTDVNITTCS